MKSTIEILYSALSPLYETGEVKAITNLLLEEVCGLTRTQILLGRDTLVLPASQRERLADCARRLSQGVPVQQVLGYEWFRGRKFAVNPDVLIPRPETAELVNMIVDKLVDNSVDNPMDNELRTLSTDCSQPGSQPGSQPCVKLVDIGTGSGCIALSLAADIHHSHVVAIDLSTPALITAQSNAKALNINNVEFVQMDILNPGYEKLSTALSTGYQPPYDVVVSNPPYICQREADEMTAQVLEHEPHMALFVPDGDPLLFYRAIARFAMAQLKPGGRLYFEINAAFGAETCALLEQMGYGQVTLRQDADGRDRFVSALTNLTTC